MPQLSTDSPGAVVFMHFAGTIHGTMDVEDIGAALQLLGCNVPGPRLKAILFDCGVDLCGSLDFACFATCILQAQYGFVSKNTFLTVPNDMDDDTAVHPCDLTPSPTRRARAQSTPPAILAPAPLDIPGHIPPRPDASPLQTPSPETPKPYEASTTALPFSRAEPPTARLPRLPRLPWTRLCWLLVLSCVGPFTPQCLQLPPP